MAEISLVIGVIGLFFVRIGVPIILLVILGTLIDRWQTRQQEENRKAFERKKA